MYLFTCPGACAQGRPRPRSARIIMLIHVRIKNNIMSIKLLSAARGPTSLGFASLTLFTLMFHVHCLPYLYGRFPKFHRVLFGRDPGTLKSDIVSKKHPQLICSDSRLSN